MSSSQISPNPLMSFEADARILQALAHPSRLEILHLLDDQVLRVSEIFTMLDLPQANSSQHLKILREAGILKFFKRGRVRVYQIADRRFLQIAYAIRLLSSECDTEANSNDVMAHIPSGIMDLVPLAHDPVCGMKVSVRLSSFHTEHGGEMYHFCASGCLKKFKQSPQKYLDKAEVKVPNKEFRRMNTQEYS